MLGFGAITEFAIAQVKSDEVVAVVVSGAVVANAATTTSTFEPHFFRETIPGGYKSDIQQNIEQELWAEREKERYKARLKAQRLRYEAKLALEAAEKELEAERLEAERQVQLAKEAELQRIDDEEAAFLLLVA